MNQNTDSGNKLKEFFKGKIWIVLTVILALNALGLTSYAAENIARSSAIGDGAAENFALIDAGFARDEVIFNRTEFERKGGSYIYEVEFYTNDMIYDYIIDSTSGRVVGKEIEPRKGIAATDPAAAQQGTGSNAAQGSQSKPAQQTPPAAADLIGVEEAKRIALQDAGLGEGDVVFSKSMQDSEDGYTVYDVEFYVNGVAEYEYEIDARSGAIRERNHETWEPDDALDVQRATERSGGSNQNYSNTINSSPTPARSTAPQKVYDDDDWDDRYDDDWDDRYDDDWDDRYDNDWDDKYDDMDDDWDDDDD